MNNEIAIKISNLSKIYTKRNTQGHEEDFYALKDLSFEVKKGEKVGIVGQNGSGKSTLLKILSGITRPTSGNVEIRGKVASILDVGTGMHPELSGRENVYLRGELLGMSTKEMDAAFDDIVEFSGIGDFIETPVKNYSSGMFLRLAFSIFAHLSYDVYLLDEVLNVGDAEFREKSNEKLNQLSKQGKTFIMVSHQLLDLERNDLFVVLKKGVLKTLTRNFESINNYVGKSLKNNTININTQNTTISDFTKKNVFENVKLLTISLYQNGEYFKTNEEFEVKIKYEKLSNFGTLDVFLILEEASGKSVFTSSPIANGITNKKNEKGIVETSCKIPSNFLASKIYKISIRFMQNLGEVLTDLKEEKIEEDINPTFSDVLIFKPVYQNDNDEIELHKINFQHNLFLGLEWN